MHLNREHHAAKEAHDFRGCLPSMSSSAQEDHPTVNYTRINVVLFQNEFHL